jgi:DeoR/GlpR family transcriptional regulator of sugar metabolism
LGRGGLVYLARLFDCDQKTIRRGIRELQRQPSLPPGRSRKKGAAASPV